MLHLTLYTLNMFIWYALYEFSIQKPLFCEHPLETIVLFNSFVIVFNISFAPLLSVEVI